MDATARTLYLDLLKRCVLGLLDEDPAIRFTWDDSEPGTLVPFDRERRCAGRDWPSRAHTMIGLERLDNLEALVTDVLAAGTPGDLIETGVWRGGATIFMRGILKAYAVSDRDVWVADSFEMFPLTEEQGATGRSFVSPGWPEVRDVLSGARPPTAAFRERSDALWGGTSYDEVRARFGRYGLLDDQVRFLRGFFRHTLASAPIERLAVLRLDGDLYDSTYDALEALYPKLSVGGYAIVDDYGAVDECRAAVEDWLAATGTQAELRWIDTDAVYWQRGA